jgi:hypothetical protein
VVQLSDRLTYWTAAHPNWRPNPEWPKEVGCVAYSTPNDLVLIDPLVRDDLSSDVWDWLDGAVEAADGKVAVLLTAPWHERSRATLSSVTAQQSGLIRRRGFAPSAYQSCEPFRPASRSSRRVESTRDRSPSS